MIQIRQATIKDIKTLQDMNDEVFKDNQQYDDDLVLSWSHSHLGAEYFSTLIDNPNGICFIAEVNGIAVGYIAAQKKSYSVRKSIILEIEKMGVNPGYRSQGIGTQLMKKCIKWGKENGYQVAYINAYVKNVKAIQFYKRSGFREADVSLEIKL